jgi:hypothetical protein
MAKLITVLLVIAICVGLALLAFKAWRSRRKGQSIKFSAPAETLDSEILERAPGQYVATTFRDEPLNRVNAYGLGFRGRAEVQVSRAGITISRRGERGLALTNDQIQGVGLAQGTIDRVVEKGGLVAIHWQQDSTELTTFLRFNNVADRNRVLRATPVLARKAI